MFWMAPPARSTQHRDSGQSQHQNAKVTFTGLVNTIYLSLDTTQQSVFLFGPNCKLNSVLSHVVSCDLPCLNIA